MIVFGEDGRVVAPGARIGDGGQADVHRVQGGTALLKLFRDHPSTRGTPALAIRARKLAAMRAMRPRMARGPDAHVAWPLELVRSADYAIVGFLMPRVDAAAPLSAVVHPRDFARRFPGKGLRFRLRVARNLAGVVASLHRDGVIVGDLNPRNVLVQRDATVALVDADSMQFEHGGERFACDVGVPEYSDPELLAPGIDFAAVWRDPACDDFALAILTFQLAVGLHPFRARPLDGGEVAMDEQNIARGHFAFGGYAPHHAPPRSAPRWDTLHPQLRDAFFAAFVRGHRERGRRPSAAAWVETLRAVEADLVDCRQSRAHQYWKRLSACPVCEPAEARVLSVPPPLPGRRGRRRGRSSGSVPSGAPASAEGPGGPAAWLAHAVSAVRTSASALGRRLAVSRRLSARRRPAVAPGASGRPGVVGAAPSAPGDGAPGDGVPGDAVPGDDAFDARPPIVVLAICLLAYLAFAGRDTPGPGADEAPAEPDPPAVDTAPRRFPAASPPARPPSSAALPPAPAARARAAPMPRVLTGALPLAPSTLCGDPRARAPSDAVAAWSDYRCRTRAEADDWSRCLPRDRYTWDPGAGCPGQERCCPPAPGQDGADAEHGAAASGAAGRVAVRPLAGDAAKAQPAPVQPATGSGARGRVRHGPDADRAAADPALGAFLAALEGDDLAGAARAWARVPERARDAPAALRGHRLLARRGAARLARHLQRDDCALARPLHRALRAAAATYAVPTWAEWHDCLLDRAPW